MNLKVIFLTLSLSILTFTSWGFCAQEVVKIATLEDYVPYCLKIKDRKANGIFPPNTDSMGFVGYSWDIIRESFHAMGYTIDLSVSPWARAMMYVKTGQMDALFPTGKNSERQKTFYYSEESVNQANFLIYVRKDNPIEWNGLKSLKGLKIGMKRGFNYGDKWDSATYFIKQDIGTIQNGFDMLDLQRIDGFAGYEINWDYVLHQAGWETKYRKLPVFDSTKEYLVALKTNPRALEILNAFDAGKKKLSQNGKLQEIEKKWFGHKHQ